MSPIKYIGLGCFCIGLTVIADCFKCQLFSEVPLHAQVIHSIDLSKGPEIDLSKCSV